jgi:hypothetical protein
MVRVHVLVEGQTEETFVGNILRPHLNQRRIYLYPRQLGKPGHRGGVGEYQRARRDILATLKQERGTVCTTMFDYYGMPASWPGRKTAAGRPEVIEEAILADVAAALREGFDPARFIPYVQMHEFEALLFSAPDVLAAGLESVDEPSVLQIRDQFQSPEEIDDSSATAPSKRIESLDASYQKVSDGILIAQRIGLNAMRVQCPHFHEWMGKLEALTRG